MTVFYFTVSLNLCLLKNNFETGSKLPGCAILCLFSFKLDFKIHFLRGTNTWTKGTITYFQFNTMFHCYARCELHLSEFYYWHIVFSSKGQQGCCHGIVNVFASVYKLFIQASLPLKLLNDFQPVSQGWFLDEFLSDSFRTF